ncbi:macrolide transporter [Lampropedia cohaerens]|uniref:Pyoverdine export ATP-binding/permease protein PvdT n=1 Tax=Lampropedia cohaerens TaxID=1610491 RepID=A0A0U1PXG6_9BURK|nr:MacB family efflux pump subunit [Lampropedia cohaerens]KKW67209.1 macrolide transporter [Lampropedia cohaerens]
MSNQPLLQLRQLRREFPAGEGTIAVLKDVDLDIHAGEMVAIVGQSGSGKSTLMNILGCLDKPTAGSYRVQGRETGQLDADELAALRREYFGFIFQRYHLLSDLTAQGNVEVPAIYAGMPGEARAQRAKALLERLGLAGRTEHTPGKLSGGQQQRVSIARALMNGGLVILADEPTGALDSASGREVMQILGELHAEGHTIILVTHDMQVAEHAQRIIEIRDGQIISDRPNTPRNPLATSAAAPKTQVVKPSRLAFSAALDRFMEAFRMALLAMNAHRLRTFLTMLGIIIGIASVVSVVALGTGTQQAVLQNIASIGTNTIEVRPGTGFGDRGANRIRTLVASDADALAQQSYADSVTPSVNSNATIRYGNVEASGQIQGVGEQFFQVRGMKLAMGSLFGREAVHARSQVAVIDDNARTTFFPDGSDPIGQVLFLGKVPVRVIGVLQAQSAAFGPNFGTVTVYLPYTTVMSRISGQSHLNSIVVRVADSVSTQAAEAGITQLLVQRHGVQDFFLMNSDTIRETIENTTQTMTLLISSIAVISLVVGGIGVMNIMLVSVTERTSEIGVRMAVGARQSDIQQQFLIEAVLVCVLGGVLGIALALLFGQVFAQFNSDFQLIYSMQSMVVAFLCASGIGIVFGYLPARNAAQLNPIDALSRD